MWSDGYTTIIPFQDEYKYIYIYNWLQIIQYNWNCLLKHSKYIINFGVFLRFEGKKPHGYNSPEQKKKKNRG